MNTTSIMQIPKKGRTGLTTRSPFPVATSKFRREVPITFDEPTIEERRRSARNSVQHRFPVRGSNQDARSSEEALLYEPITEGETLRVSAQLDEESSVTPIIL